MLSCFTLSAMMQFGGRLEGWAFDWQISY